MPNRFVLAIIVVVPVALLAAACVIVREEEDGRTVGVDMSGPAGAMSARTGGTAGNTGLPVFPGASLSRDSSHGDYERATVSIATPWMGLHVVAAEYESSESPERILGFYREQMTLLGAVTECRGDVNFRGSRPECRSHPSAAEVQLVVGVQENHRLVTIQPQGDGSQFSLVSIQTGDTQQ
jgi:hypothetical protein